MSQKLGHLARGNKCEQLLLSRWVIKNNICINLYVGFKNVVYECEIIVFPAECAQTFRHHNFLIFHIKSYLLTQTKKLRWAGSVLYPSKQRINSIKNIFKKG
jgi:hypothetical protein